MAGIGKKLLSFIGLEESELDQENYDSMEEPEMQERGYRSERYNSTKDYQDEYNLDDYEETYEELEEPKMDRNRSKIIGMPERGLDGNLKVVIYQPTTYEDTQNIIDNLKSRKPIVVNLDEMDPQVAQRVLDFISGAVYSLAGHIRKVARNIFLVTPSTVDIATNLRRESGEDMYADNRR